MAGIGEAAGSEIAKIVVNCIAGATVTTWKYYKFNEYVEKVIQNDENLNAMAREKVQEVNEAKWRGKTTGDTYNLWEGRVNEMKKKNEILFKEAEEVNKGLWKGRLKVYKRLCLSRKAEKLNAVMNVLLIEGKDLVKWDGGVGPVAQLQAVALHKDLESRDQLMGDVIKALQKEENYVVGIWGKVGVGKTMLADEVLSRVLYDKLFMTTVKVEIIKDHSIPYIQSMIASQSGLGRDMERLHTEDERAELLLRRLGFGSRILVLLDNVRDELLLHKIGLPLGERCKVLVTCRNHGTLRTMQVTEIIKVEPLSLPEARQLFQKIPSNFSGGDFADKILNECVGLPLAITIVAGALRNSGLYSGERVLVQLKESTVPEEFDLEKYLYSPIKVSYNLLENELQRLLLLCCLFPEGADIPIQKLVRFVKALQLLNVFDSTLLNTSNHVLSLIDDLKNCCLLLRGDDGTTVKINQVVRTVCLSISSNQKHKPKLMKWPYDNEEQQLYTGISLTSDDQMQQLHFPDDLGPELLKLQDYRPFSNLSEDFFKGMREDRVVDFKGTRIWYEFTPIQEYLPILNILTNLRTLCMEYCDLSNGDLSMIKSLKHLEVLSFFCSKLDSLPIEVQQLANLTVLDLRCISTGYLIIPSNVLSALTKLEELYLGNYMSWLRHMGQPNRMRGIMITELSELPLLRVLQIIVRFEKNLLQLKEEALFERLVKFDIIVSWQESIFSEYEIGKSITLDRIKWDSLLDMKIQKLLKITECLILHLVTFRNLFASFSGLKTLELDECNVEYIMEKEDSAVTLNKLKHLEIKEMCNLLAICEGDLPSKSLVNLETIKLVRLHELKYLWRAPLGSGCLVNLRVLEMTYCDTITFIFPFSIAKGLVQLEVLDITSCKRLKWIVFKEEDGTTCEKIVLPKLRFLSLDDLRNFRSFYSDSVEKKLIEKRGCLWFALKRKASHTREQPAEFTVEPEVDDWEYGPEVDDLEYGFETKKGLLNQLVELPSMNKLMIIHIYDMEHIVDDQTSTESVSKIKVMVVIRCKNLLSVAASGHSIRSLQSLEHVNVDKCESMETLFDFGMCNVENPSTEAILNKLETVSLQKLNSLKQVFRMVPETTPCFQNLMSLEISDCQSLEYVFSVSIAKMLGKLEVLKVTSCAMVKQIIEIDIGYKDETDIIKFSSLRVLQLEDLASMSSFSSGNHDFNFPELQDMLVLECPTMTSFCTGRVRARQLNRVRVGDLHPHLQVRSQDALNETIKQLHIDRYELKGASDEIEEV